jgi:hypothetical protein
MILLTRNCFPWKRRENTKLQRSISMVLLPHFIFQMIVGFNINPLTYVSNVLFKLALGKTESLSLAFSIDLTTEQQHRGRSVFQGIQWQMPNYCD